MSEGCPPSTKGGFRETAFVLKLLKPSVNTAVFANPQPDILF